MSNRTVTYVDFELDTPAAYWADLVVPNLREYKAAPSRRLAMQAATYSWHLHEWVWHEQHPGEDTRGGDYITFRNDLVARCPELGWLRDVTDASKHRGLNRQPEVAEAKPQFFPAVAGSSGGGLGLGLGLGLGGGRPPTPEHWKFVLMMSDGSTRDMDNVLRAAARFWEGTIPDIEQAPI